MQKENRRLRRAPVAQRGAGHLFPVVAGDVPVLICAFWERQSGHNKIKKNMVKKNMALMKTKGSNHESLPVPSKTNLK